MTGIDVKHIPYRGTPAVVTALRAGEVDYAVELVHAVQGQVQAGELKLLAVGSPHTLAEQFRMCRQSPNPACRAIR